MKNIPATIAVALAAFCCSACTDNSGDEADGHLLETQQEALERARGVEQDVAEAAGRRAEQTEGSEENR